MLYFNPYCSDMPAIKTRKIIHDSIPDDYTLLYPEARAMKRHFILHIGETNTGKTHDAVQDMMKAESGIYLAPLRLLALETQEKLLNSGIECSMVTGEEEDIRSDSMHMSATVEIYMIGST